MIPKQRLGGIGKTGAIWVTGGLNEQVCYSPAGRDISGAGPLGTRGGLEPLLVSAPKGRLGEGLFGGAFPSVPPNIPNYFILLSERVSKSKP